VSKLILLAIPVILLTVLFAPVHWLLFLDILLLAVPADAAAAFGGVRFDLTDLVFVGILIAYAFRGERLLALGEVSLLRLWFLLGVLLSLSYLMAPSNQVHLTEPHRIAYQLYRYCWKPILFFPFVYLFIAGPIRMRVLFFVLVVTGDLLSLQAVWQGYSPGGGVTGPFNSGNALGSALGVSLLVCVGMLTLARSSRERLILVFSLLLMLRAMLFTGSRGALIALSAGAVALLWGLSSLPRVRARILPIGMAATIGVAMVLFNPIGASSLRRLETLREGTGVSTFQWRMEERWPHFISLSMEHPWLGTGSNVDSNLGSRGNTPHNGYLALAFSGGIPVLAIYLAFAFLALRAVRRALARSTAEYEKVFCAIIAGAMIFMLARNIVESDFMTFFGGKYFWLFSALALSIERLSERRSPRVRVPAYRLPSQGSANSALRHRPVDS